MCFFPGNFRNRENFETEARVLKNAHRESCLKNFCAKFLFEKLENKWGKKWTSPGRISFEKGRDFKNVWLYWSLNLGLCCPNVVFCSCSKYHRSQWGFYLLQWIVVIGKRVKKKMSEKNSTCVVKHVFYVTSGIFWAEFFSWFYFYFAVEHFIEFEKQEPQQCCDVFRRQCVRNGSELKWRNGWKIKEKHSHPRVRWSLLLLQKEQIYTKKVVLKTFFCVFTGTHSAFFEKT